MSTPSVSVIIPVYNGENFIEETLINVLSQDGVDIELIVVSDGSTDGTKELVEKGYSNQLRFIDLPHKGKSHALNQGIRAASNNAIAFIDADDLWASNKLSIQLPYLSDYDLILTKIRQFLSPGTSTTPSYNLAPMEGSTICTMLTTKEVFHKVGYFDEDLVEGGEFLEWYSRVIDYPLTHFEVNEVLCMRRLHDANWMMSKTNTMYPLVLKKIIDRRKKLKQ